MRYVSFAFVGEGPSDWSALGVIVQRTIERIALRADGPEPFMFGINDAGKSSNENIRAVVESAEYDVVIVHRDGAASPEDVRAGIAVLGAPTVPLVPRREMEAWLIADCAAICRCAGRSSGCPLDDAECGRIAEGLPDPKATLRAMLSRCRPGRPPVDDMLGMIAATLSMEALGRFAWYRRFAEDLGTAVRSLPWV